ncbi:MAG TPA: hypothetical protein VFL60_05030 [Gaiellaceae bacterium]|nr:hypothetical protein [Gaiellaceae bacterium]
MVAALAAAAALASSHIVFTADDTPKLYGEIYRVAPDGARTNLSRSPAADVAPAVSPDGRRVAFVSARGGRARVYVVGAGGRGLRPLSPPLAPVGPSDGVVARIAWAPDARRLVVELNVGGAAPSLYVTRLDGGWRRIAGGGSGAVPAWSPDGTRLAYSLGSGLVVVADAGGRTLWRAGGTGAPGWSRTGRLAVQQNSTTVAVYDAAGKPLGAVGGGSFAWSPDGRVLATVRAGVLQLRGGGVGRPTLSARIFRGQKPVDADPVDWLSSSRLRVVGGGDGLWHGYDVARRRPFALPAALRAFGAIDSAHGVGASVRYGSPTVALRLGSRTVAAAPSCGDDDPFESLQFVGRTNALVYQSGCPLPSADVYSVAPDGSGLQRVTSTPAHELDPALSPDGTRVAFAREQRADRCDGCPQSLWLTSPTQQLTSRQPGDDAPFDERPSWSPDGSTLVFERSGASVRPGLFTVPAAGGAAHDLQVPGSHPAWGPKLIAFAQVTGGSGIGTLDPASGAVRTVLAGVDPTALAWSADGRLAYLAAGGGGRPQIGIVGSPVKIDLSRLLPPRSLASGLAWSPDGTRFAFAASDANGVGEIYTVGVDGKGLVQVTHDLGAVFRLGDLTWR